MKNILIKILEEKKGFPKCVLVLREGSAAPPWPTGPPRRRRG